MQGRTACLLLFVAFVLVASYQLSQVLCPIDDVDQSSSSSSVTRDAQMDEMEDLEGAEVEEEELTDSDEQAEREGLSEDITFLFAIINMNRRTHMGIENYTFEADYLEQLKGFLRDFRPHKVQIIIQRKYYDYVKADLYDNVHVRYVEIEELRAWKYYQPIETIRNSGWWVRNTPWLANVPQGYSDLHIRYCEAPDMI